MNTQPKTLVNPTLPGTACNPPAPAAPLSMARLSRIELWAAENAEQLPFTPLRPAEAALWMIVAVAAFHLSYAFECLSGLMLVFLFSLIQLRRLRTPRHAVLVGLAVGVAIYGPHLAFFWSIFGPPAALLWLVLAAWLALFLALTRRCLVAFGSTASLVVAPIAWTGLEYFRCELYYLKFGWLTPGFAFSNAPALPLISGLGVYGIGFALTLLAAAACLLPRRASVVAVAGAATVLTLAAVGFHTPPRATGASVQVTGIQFEFADEDVVMAGLDKAVAAHPDTDLFVLSEYTFPGTIPASVRRWCREHHKHLVAGGKEEYPDGKWRNTAFVVNTEGEIVFQQAKSVPIQFFDDGLPAKEQQVWNSHWGRIGIAICYDLSYSRVIDGLVRKGAQALIVPTMDVQDWGSYQHQLHARVAPLRAAEYGMPIFRVASSGISQLTTGTGKVLATASFPGQGEMIHGTLEMATATRLPVDRTFAPACLAIAGLSLVAGWFRMWKARRPVQAA